MESASSWPSIPRRSESLKSKGDRPAALTLLYCLIIVEIEVPSNPGAGLD
jgi:hypothetical protein